MHVFISHSSKDAKTAAELCAVLEGDGNRCFLAPRDIRSGYEYAEEIINGIDSSDLVVLVLSEHSNRSPHVLREVERAVSQSIPIIVYKLQEVSLTRSMEYFLMTHQWLGAQSGGGYSELAECVRKMNADNTGLPPQNESVVPEKKKSSRFSIFKGVAVLLSLVAAIGLAIMVPRFITEKNLEVGEEITFGSYNNEPVTWRVLRISEDKTEAVLISKDILTMKAYDAPESGKYNYDGEKNYWGQDLEADLELQARVRGNSMWSTSNIRTWLNSDQEAVKYEGQAPVARAMSNMQNGYHGEPGFLYGFTEDERERIQETENITKTNGLMDSNETKTQDKVYLLSKEELSWFEEAGMSVLAKPTAAAVEQDGTKWYKSYSLDIGVDTFAWWLRDPVETASDQCYMVGNGYGEDTVTSNYAALEGFGIRPAITLKIR